MGARVMIVDDEPYIRLAVRKLLKRRGVELLEADCGKACLENLRQGFRGLILMDVMMPRMNGWETVRQIVDQGLHEGNIIFMLTALETPGEQIEDLQKYIVDYITKPFEPEVLLATCETYLAYLEKMQTTGVK